MLARWRDRVRNADWAQPIPLKAPTPVVQLPPPTTWWAVYIETGRGYSLWAVVVDNPAANPLAGLAIPPGITTATMLWRKPFLPPATVATLSEVLLA